MNRTKLCEGFAMLIGVFLIVEGIWGMFSNTVFGILSTNKTHALIHIILGVTGLYFGRQGGARSYCIFLGILLLLVGILRFIYGADELLIRLINVNEPVAYLNIIIGAIALVLAMLVSDKKNTA